MKYYEIEEIYSWLYRISEPANVHFYLVVGQEKALLFDTGHGIGNIPEVVKSITSKSVIVVLGHAHIDHANGAFQFTEVFLNENDFTLFRQHTSPAFRESIVKELEKSGRNPYDYFDPEDFVTAGEVILKELKYNTVFNLGGLNLKVVNMAGHTKGSIGLLILEHKILLVSDSANGHIWMFLNESTSISEYISMLERISQLDFNSFLTAHSNITIPKSDFQKYIKVAKEASIDKSVPYNAFPELEPYIYEKHGVAIVFNAKSL